MRILGFLMATAITLLSMLLAAPDALAVDPLLRRAPGSALYGPAPVWTKANDTTGIFHPLSPMMPSAGALGARVQYQMSEETTLIKLRAAVRYSADGLFWDTGKELYSDWAIADGIQYQTAYVNLLTLASTPQQTWMQFGVFVIGEAGNSIVQHANATILVEWENK